MPGSPSCLPSRLGRAIRVLVTAALLASGGCAEEVVTTTEVGFYGDNSCFSGVPISTYIVELYTVDTEFMQCQDCFLPGATCARTSRAPSANNVSMR